MIPSTETLYQVLNTDIDVISRAKLLTTNFDYTQLEQDVKNPEIAFSFGLMVRKVAYGMLVNSGDIKPDHVHNIGIGTQEKPYIGDMGFMGDKTYRFSQGEWHFAY